MKKFLRAALALALLAGVWWWLLQHADLAAMAGRIALLPAWAWAAAGIGLLAGHFMRALRLRAEWRHRGDPGLAACLRMVLVHNAAVLLIPLRGGEGAYLWMVTRQWGGGWAAAAASLLRWRLQDLLVLCAAAILLLMPWSVAGRLLALLALILLAANGLPPLWPWLARRSGLAMQAEQAGPDGQAEQGARQRVLLGDLWHGTGASLALWSLKIMANGGLIGALAGLPLEAALRAGLGGELGGVQPLQPPAGLGAYEAGVWLAVRLPVERAPELVAAALAVHAFSLCIALAAAALAQVAIPPSAGSGLADEGAPAARRQSGG